MSLKEAIEKEKQELRQQMVEYKRQKEEELGKKEAEWQQKAQAEKVALQKQIEESHFEKIFLLILKIKFGCWNRTTRIMKKN